ncbi:cell wall-binding repeat-containing protein [Dehalobacter sp.]|uniref:cell wall-binding repeat-containing protein n=1 Tax=Dehalobacter sp. TaxID=1962289 RepID=UPI00258C9568|nr:cell wall-binding repeat-containing protein [Dehalobacter sp.]MCG1024850.1 cell wall-binding repeat-containing protein [Dehalobacter sp.]
MSRTKKIAVLAIIAMVLTLMPAAMFAATADSTRLEGANRIATAIDIASAGTWGTTVVLAPADNANLVDALAAAPLAGQENAPILLTFKGSLDAAVKAKIAALGATKVYVVGAISADVAAEVDAMTGVAIEALKGNGRIETAKAVNAKLTSPAGTFVVGYDAIADALSVASFAAKNKYAIVLANQDGSVASADLVGATKYIIGGTAKVDDISGVTRISGADRFATNKAVADTLAFTYDRVYVANGVSLVDALAVAPLAAKYSAFVALASGSDVAAASTVNAKLASTSKVIAVGGTSAVSDAVKGKVGFGVVTPTGDVKVQSVSAISASSLKVTFGAAPADTTKVVFTVTRNTTPITVTTTWDSTKTVATLTASANLPEGDYNVAVKNDATDLGSSKVTIAQQKIAQIKITSDKLSVTSAGLGYATYQVLDQYGNDITTSYLTSSLNFQSGVTSGAGGSINWTTTKGLLKLTPTTGLNLIQFATVVITGYDSNTGVSASATLTTSSALGTLSSIKLNSLTNANNAVLTDGSSETWYIDYTATDMSGNATKNYELVHSGLILGTGASLDQLTSSSTYVVPKLVQDPTDSSKAVIQVTVLNGGIAMDTPVVVTAMAYNGGTSTLNLTLKKAAKTDTFTLMAPSFDIAVNETKEIPFVAYDQNGTQVKKFSELNAAGIVFSPTGKVVLEPNVDGTAKLMVGPFAAKGSQLITAMTTTGKNSSLTLNIQDAAVPTTLNLSTTKIVSAMQVGATQKVDFGFVGPVPGKGGLSVLDQYGRTFDMVGAPGNYRVRATVAGAVTAPGGPISGNGQITITAGGAAGQGSVTFELYDSTAAGTPTISSKTVSFSVIASADITDYTMDQLSTPLYTASAVGATSAAGRVSDYFQNPYVYGKTAAGSKVVLAATPITGAYTTSPSFFASSAGTYDGVKVYATAFSDPAKTSATATLTVTVLGADGLHSVSTPINSTTAPPVASSVAVLVDTSAAGISQDGDIITVDLSDAVAANIHNTIITRWKNDDGTAVTRAPFYLYALDQYNTKAMAFSQITKLAGSTAPAGGFDVNSTTGVITYVPANLTAGDYADITVVTKNGLIKTIRIKFVA